jgi:hypothetical protein
MTPIDDQQLLPIIENIAQLQQMTEDIYKLYKKEYNAQRYKQNRDKMRKQASDTYFQKKIDDPDYIQKLRDKTTKRRLDKIISSGKEPQKVGRPKLNKVVLPKKAIGRPRLW